MEITTHYSEFAGCTASVGSHWRLVTGSLTEATDSDVGTAADRFESSVRPVLEKHCYGCHGDGENECRVTLHSFANRDSALDRDLWFRVLRNVLADIMPRAGQDQLTLERASLVEKLDQT